LNWIEVTSIGDDIAFVIGKNNSFSISPQNLPSGWNSNCIYFTDDHKKNKNNKKKKRELTMVYKT
jgi:hypothetical protein